jgi:hypothetical protein
MGLEIVELVIAVEELFDIAIPDEVAAGLLTPRHVMDYVSTRVPTAPPDRCLTQHTFYKVRRGLRATVGAGTAVTPATRLDTVAAEHTWPAVWSTVREAAGTSGWPETTPWPGWLRDGPVDLRALVLHIVTHLPQPDPARGESWTRERIELALREVVYQTVGRRGFSLDDEFVGDLGLD